MSTLLRVLAQFVLSFISVLFSLLQVFGILCLSVFPYLISKTASSIQPHTEAYLGCVVAFRAVDIFIDTGASISIIGFFWEILLAKDLVAGI